jgi:hypothetical protein
MNWEDKFQSWSQPLSQNERTKCENAERAIKRAIRDDKTLSKLNIRVFPQGSYCAGTNIRLDSDVDICICLREPFFTDYPPGKTREDLGLVKGSPAFSEYKRLIENALVYEFGKTSVKRGDKAFNIHKNSYRIDADVVPTYAHRRYTGKYNSDGTHHYITPTGVELISDKGKAIINWPEQTFENRNDKNDKTGKRFKRIIKILKVLRNEMQEVHIKEADNIASFLIESLIWNVPNSGFGHAKLSDDVKFVIAHCYNYTLSDEKCKEWREVNELKYLFRSSQPWTRVQAHDFLSAAWTYIGFK